MYPVSNDYLTEIAKNNPTTRITGTLTLTSGNEVSITNDTIAKAPTIRNQCVNNSELKLGQAYQAQLDISIYSDINRYSVYGARIELSFELKIGSSWEEVPLGVFIVSECNRTSNNVLQITAVDEMDKLDKKYTGEALSGHPYSILSYIASNHGLPLAQTEEEIEALPNGSRVFGMSDKYRSDTWRDVVGDIAAVLAGNAVIDREGKLFIQSFATSVTRTIPASARSRETISDYLVAYSSVSCIKDGEVFSVGMDSDQDITLDDNDFLQSGSADGVSITLTNILNAISPLVYTPSDISWYGDPSLDLGDLIEATGAAAAASTMIPLQKYKWTWRGNHQIVAVGKNPNLGEVKSQTDKKISNLVQNTVENEVTYYQYTNIEAITFGSEQEVKLAELRFVSAQKTTVKILHEFIFDMLSDLALDGSYELHYYLDDQLLPYKPYERVGTISGLVQGSATDISITRDFFYILKDVDPNIPHTWEVKIITHNIDSTTIDATHARVVLEGQRLYGETYFDGLIEAEDLLSVVPIGNLRAVTMTDSVSIRLDDAALAVGHDNIPIYDLSHLKAKPMTDSVQIFMEGGLYLITEDGRYITTEDGRRLKTEE